MPIEWEFESTSLAVFRVSGQLGKGEFDRAQAENEDAIQRAGKANILVLLNDFSGWERAEGWEDVSFMERNDPFIRKMAIVGEPQWRDHIYAFTGRGLRPVEIEYFQDEAAARRWLNE